MNLCKIVLAMVCASVLFLSATVNADAISITSNYQGWVNSAGIGNGARNGLNTFTGNENGDRFNSWASFDLSALSTKTATSAQVKLVMATWPSYSTAIYTLDMFDVSTPLSSFQNASSGVAGYNDLMTGNKYASVTGGNGTYYVNLSSQAIADMNAKHGGTFIIGFTNVTLNSQNPAGVDIGEYINGFWGQPQNSPVLTVIPSAVPEPGTGMLSMIGMILVAMYGFCVRRKSN